MHRELATSNEESNNKTLRTLLTIYNAYDPDIIISSRCDNRTRQYAIETLNTV